MFGTLFNREIAIAPRRDVTYVTRSLYVGVLLLIVITAWLVFSGTQLITDVGDFARFAQTLFGLLAPIQLILLTFLAAMFSAGAVAQEKDRKTMILLLLTRLSNHELVLGKLMASLLPVITMLLLSLPIFMFVVLLGGVSYYQILRVMLVTLLSVFAFGSVGSTIALWRDKTFQALAATVLLIVIWIGICEVINAGMLGKTFCGISSVTLAAAFSPWRAIQIAAQPAIETTGIAPIQNFLIAAAAVAVAINLLAIAMVRVWNPSRETRSTTLEQDTWIRNTSAEEHLLDAITFDTKVNHEQHLAAGEDAGSNVNVHAVSPGRVRHVWDNPVLWREIRTRAYGRKMWAIHATYILFFLMCSWSLWSVVQEYITPSAVQIAGAVVPLLFLSLVLVNAQAISSMTSERDGGTLDLLLVSDISPKEFVVGKLVGIFYNMKWCVGLPLLIFFALYFDHCIDFTPLVFLVAGCTVLFIFVAMIGLHIGMNNENTRTAAAMSLGTVFFLFVGITACIWIMVVFSGSFEAQLQPFVAFMVGGGAGLYVTLGGRNPSQAIAWAAFMLPPATFYIITSLLNGSLHLGFLVGIIAYGFTTLAMLIPAIAEFDTATGRTAD